MRIIVLGDFTHNYYMHKPHDSTRVAIFKRMNEIDDVEVKFLQVTCDKFVDDECNMNRFFHDKWEELEHFDPDIIFIVRPESNAWFYNQLSFNRHKQRFVFMYIYDLWEPFEKIFLDMNNKYGVNHVMYSYRSGDKFISDNIKKNCKRIPFWHDDYNLTYDLEMNPVIFMENWKNRKYDVGCLGRMTMKYYDFYKHRYEFKCSWHDMNVDNYNRSVGKLSKKIIGKAYGDFLRACRYYLCTPAGVDHNANEMTLRYIESMACGVMPVGEESISEDFLKIRDNITFNKIIKERSIGETMNSFCQNINDNYVFVKCNFSATVRAPQMLEYFKEVLRNG